MEETTMTDSMHVVMPLSIEVTYDNEAGCWQSRCPELDVFSAGNSQQEAFEGAVGAINMTMTSYYRHGRLDELLKKRQFEPVPIDDMANGMRFEGGVTSPFVLCSGREDAVCADATAG